jgi:hypothetical protein
VPTLGSRVAQPQTCWEFQGKGLSHSVSMGPSTFASHPMACPEPTGFSLRVGYHLPGLTQPPSLPVLIANEVPSGRSQSLGKSELSPVSGEVSREGQAGPLLLLGSRQVLLTAHTRTHKHTHIHSPLNSILAPGGCLQRNPVLLRQLQCDMLATLGGCC